MNLSLLFILFCISNIEFEQKIIIGPIIGKVTNTTARILVEFELNSNITMIITSLNKKEKYNTTIEVFPSHPVIFKFYNLSPQTQYFISFTHNYYTINMDNSSFKTLSSKINLKDSFNLVFVACNDIRYANKIPTEKNLWLDMAEKASKGEIDYVFHIGDQVYLDSDDWYGNNHSAYSMSKSLYADFFNHTEEIRESIRNEYRKTFKFPPMASLLSKVPNIMILDDHEVHNEFSRSEEFKQEGTWFNFWSTQARYVYYQYQRQLREDIDFDNLNSVTQEYFAEVLSNIGFFFLDYRGSRVWYPNDFNTTHNYLDRNQKEYLNLSFSKSPQAIFKDTEAAFVISTVPVFMLSQEITKLLAKSISQDYDELWTFNHLNELEELLDLIRLWKYTKIQDYNREVFLIGGDMHFGFQSQIFYKEEPVFKQFTTSGINMEMFDEEHKNLVDIIMSMRHTKIKKYSIVHHDWTTLFNYGVVKIFKDYNETINDTKNNTDKKIIKIESYLMTSDGKSINRTKSIFSNDTIDIRSGKISNVKYVKDFVEKMEIYK